MAVTDGVQGVAGARGGGAMGRSAWVGAIGQKVQAAVSGHVRKAATLIPDALLLQHPPATLRLVASHPQGTDQFDVFPFYDNIGNSLLSLFISQLQNQDTRSALNTMYSQVAIIVCCLYAFLANIIMINLIITLMSDLFTSIKQEQDLVFLRNRAGAAGRLAEGGLGPRVHR